MSPLPSFSIRLATAADASEVARLLTELGFPTAAESIAAQWQEWSEAKNAALVAARSDGTLAGLITMHQMNVLHRTKLVGRITALVVEPLAQKQGLGRALVLATEEMLVSAGCGLLEVTSNAQLSGAHAFYEHLGYERTSIRLAKVLDPAT
jgi:predicted N-acetyltransferase YhbS